MNKLYILICIPFCAFLLSCSSRAGMNENDNRAKELLSRMTLEEKVGQMAQITFDVIGKGPNRYASFEPLSFDSAELRKALVDYHIGSVLNTANNKANTPEIWFNLISQIQEVAVNETRLGIPVLYGIDAIHGATYTAGATMFPQQIAQAATFNRALVREAAEITAYETRASGIPWNFSPVLDLGSDPRFARQWETFGEDPYLCSELGVQAVDGYEGEDNDISHPEKVAACVKHFLGYMTPSSGKDRTPANISEQELREYHLPSFKAAIEAGAHSVMINSGIINGIPVHANYNILTRLLKEELGFRGIIATDWADIENLYGRDRIARDDKEAIMLAINAGIDMSMIPYNYEVFCDNLLELVREGKVKEARIDDAVARILEMKFKLGLFETPTTGYRDYPRFGSTEFEEAAYRAAAESITLLKNENNALPLDKGVKLLVTGPNAHSMRTLNGAWTYSWQGEKVEMFAEKHNTILEAIRENAGKENVTYVPGVSYKMEGQYYEEYTDRMDEAVAAAKKADAIILCIGENSYAETPGNLNDLYIPDLQTELAEKLMATGKPVIVALNEGRPRIISRFEERAQAVVQVYLPGNFGGDALAAILFGEVNPSGRLPYTYPRYPNSLISYIHKPSEERETMAGAYNYSADFNPQYEFGHGLSYTTFEYTNLVLSDSMLEEGKTIKASVEVTNTGQRDGKETVLMFVSDLTATLITPDVKRLRGFEKISLAPRERKTVSFEIAPEDIAFVNHENRKITEPGEFKLTIGGLESSFHYETQKAN